MEKQQEKQKKRGQTAARRPLALHHFIFDF